MIFIDCIQGTPEWHEARTGVITASRYKDACSLLKNGEPSGKQIDYMNEVALEILSHEKDSTKFVTKFMREGTEQEPFARRAYEAKTGNLAEEAGIVLTDDKRFGYSTDGFVDDDGMIEIKCLASATSILNILRTGDISDYIHQIQGGMWLTRRKWCDFVMYVPKLSGIGQELYIKRIYRDEDFIEKMELQLISFMHGVDEIVKEVQNNLLKEAA